MRIVLPFSCVVQRAMQVLKAVFKPSPSILNSSSPVLIEVKLWWKWKWAALRSLHGVWNSAHCNIAVGEKTWSLASLVSTSHLYVVLVISFSLPCYLLINKWKEAQSSLHTVECFEKAWMICSEICYWKRATGQFPSSQNATFLGFCGKYVVCPTWYFLSGRAGPSCGWNPCFTSGI